MLPAQQKLGTFNDYAVPPGTNTTPMNNNRATGMVATGPLAVPPVRLALSGRNSRKIPERPRKRSQSFSWHSLREYGWDPPNPIIQGI